MHEAQFFVSPFRASRGGAANLNCKFKTFGFLDTLKVHIHSLITLQVYCILHISPVSNVIDYSLTRNYVRNFYKSNMFIPTDKCY